MSYTGIMITLKNSNNIVEHVIGSQLVYNEQMFVLQYNKPCGKKINPI